MLKNASSKNIFSRFFKIKGKRKKNIPKINPPPNAHRLCIPPIYFTEESIHQHRSGPAQGTRSRPNRRYWQMNGNKDRMLPKPTG
tara:strand:+ start:210 stop:464 length:255 start_codon:yes stop_codon:yes gene_type:complete